MSEESIPNPFSEHLNRQELELLDALVKSGAFPVLKKAIRIWRQNELELLGSAPSEKVPFIQGRIQGLELFLSIPLLMQKTLEQVVKKEAAKEEAEKKAKRSRRG